MAGEYANFVPPAASRRKNSHSKQATVLLPEEEWHRRNVSGTRWWERTYIGMIERGERNLSPANVGICEKALEISMTTILPVGPCKT